MTATSAATATNARRAPVPTPSNARRAPAADVSQPPSPPESPPRVRGLRREARSRSAERRRVSALPFLALVAGLLGAGLLSLLMINNSLAAGSFEQSRLKADRILLGEQEQALRQEVERLSSPTRVREAARQAGFIPAATTAYFDVTTGQILGTPLPADPTGTAPGSPAAVTPALVDPATGLPVDPTTGLPVDPATAPVDGTAAPTAVDPANPQDPTAVTDPGAAATPPPDPEADGAVVGGDQPGGVTAYDRAIVSGGGR